MRKKLLYGLLAVVISGFVAGGYVFNSTSGAQEPLKKMEPEKRPDDLFELLKKDLEKPKSLPALPAAPDGPPVPPPSIVQAQGQVPSLPALNINGPVAKEPASLPAPMPSTLPPESSAPLVTPPQPGFENRGTITAPKQTPFGGPEVPINPHVAPIPATEVKAVPVAVNTIKAAKLKSSPWSVHVEIIDEQTIVTVSVNKKHEFKILCQHVDLQTAQSTLKATGKVKIDGDSLQGSCDNLTIPLYEDRLVLEGNGELRIRKASTNVTTESIPAMFELKGEKLNLRISELETSRFIETSWRRLPDPSSIESDGVVPMKAATVKQWSPYGKLRQTKLEHEGQPVYLLEKGDGQPILHLVGSSNKSLTQYVGQTISVYGPSIEQSSIRGLLRVSHIAVP